MRKSNLAKILFVLATVFIVSNAFVYSTQAASDIGSVKRRANYNILERCYNKDHIVFKFNMGIGSGGSDGASFTGPESVFTDNKIENPSLYTITEETDKSTPDAEKCSTILTKVFGAPSDNNDASAYLETLGYSYIGEGSSYGDTGCVRTYYGTKDTPVDDSMSGWYTAGDVCWGSSTPGGNWDQPAVYPATTNNPGNIEIVNARASNKRDTSGGGRVGGTGQNEYGSFLMGGDNAQYCQGVHINVYGPKVTAWLGWNADSFEKSLISSLSECPEVSNMVMFISRIDPSQVDGLQTLKSYSFGRKSSEEIFTELRTRDGMTNKTITAQEAFDIYTHYLINIYHASFNKDCVKNVEDFTGNSRVYTTSGWCTVVPGSTNASKKVAVFGRVAGTDGDGQQTIDGAPNRLVVFTSEDDDGNLIGEMKNLVVSSYNSQFGNYTITPIEYDNGGDGGGVWTPNPDPGLTEGEQDPCYNSSGQLGWLLCPLVRNIGNAMASMYNDIIKDFLTIESSLMSQDANKGGTYIAWQTFVGFANIIVIVFLLVIIFSQVTGVGIDNYGIKKALPKIIIAAVLVNLSFILCQLLVDLSNIVGNSIQSLLSGIGDNLAQQSRLSEFGGWQYSDGGAFRFILDATVITAGAGAVLGVVSAFNNGGVLGLLIPLVFGLLIGLIAILFFFTLLGIRKAAIITLVAVSPVAFACYMLPNLKKQVFDRWFSIFKTMLLAYPLCGLIIGGSHLASGILMLNAPNIEDNNGFLYYFINMILMVVPFFFLPSIIRKSMGALGTLTQKATNAARGIARNGRSRAEDWNRKRPAIQARNAAREERRNQRWAQRRSDRGVTGPFFRQRQRAEVDRARQILAKQAETEAMRNVRVDDSSWLTGARGQAEVNALKEQLDKANYASGSFVEGAQFLAEQNAADQKARNQRYAGETAQTALAHKLASARHKDAVDDETYATDDSFNAAIQANKEAAIKTQTGFATSALANNQLGFEVTDPKTGVKTVHNVNQNRVGNVGDVGSLAWGHRQAIEKLRTAKTDAERVEATSRLQAIQSALMRTDDGVTGLKSSLMDAAKSATDNGNDPLRTLASRLNETDGNALKGKDRDLHQLVQDLAGGKPVANISSAIDNNEYRGNGISKLSAESLSKCTPDYVKNMTEKAEELYNIHNAGGKLDSSQIGFLNSFLELRSKYNAPTNTKAKTNIKNIIDDPKRPWMRQRQN